MDDQRRVLRTDVDGGLRALRDFVQTYHSQALHFEFCNGYVLQATRNGFWYWSDNTAIVFVTRKEHTGEYVIVCAAGQGRTVSVVRVAQYLWQQRHAEVIIKNVDAQLETELIALGCRHARVNEWWDSATKYDDNSFPEVILDVNKLVMLQGGELRSMREERNRFYRDYTVQIKRSGAEDTHERGMLLQRWAQGMHARKGWNGQALTQATELFFANHDYLFPYAVRDMARNTLIGYMVFSEISPVCLGMNVLITDFSYRNAFRLFILEAVHIASQLGYAYLNIQGSEDTNQYLSKKRMHGGAEVYKEHLFYDGQACTKAAHGR